MVSGTSGVSNPMLRVSFASTGSTNVLLNAHYIQLDGDEEAFSFNCKCSEVYISTLKANSGYQLYAELTGIHSNEMYFLTGSGINT